MKRLMALAVALLMLSCSCQNEVRESKVCTKLPRPAATPSQRGTDGAQIMLKVERIIDGDTFEGHVIQNPKTAYNPGVNPWMVLLTKIVVRINGIDAPERGQFYGDVATLHL